MKAKDIAPIIGRSGKSSIISRAANLGLASKPVGRPRTKAVR